MRSLLRSFRRAPVRTRHQLEPMALAVPDADSSQRGIASPKSVAASSSRNELSVLAEIIEDILEFFWRNTNLFTPNARYRSYRALSLTSRSIRAIVQNLAIRYVVCTTILEFEIHFNLALAHTRTRTPHVLPASIELTTKPLYLVPLNAFLSSPVHYPLSRRAKKVLLKLRNVHDLGELPLFHDTQSITITITLGMWPVVPDWRLAHEWLTQAPSLTSMSFHDFDLTIMWTLIQWGKQEYAMRPRITHLTLSVSTRKFIACVHWAVLFPNVDTLELYDGPTDLEQLRRPRPTTMFPFSMTTLILHAPPGATLLLLNLWGVTKFLDNYAIDTRNTRRDELRIIFDTSDQEPLGWASAVASAAPKGVTLLRRSGCCTMQTRAMLA
jgi:hypothetical protein